MSHEDKQYLTYKWLVPILVSLILLMVAGFASDVYSNTEQNKSDITTLKANYQYIREDLSEIKGALGIKQ